MTKMHHVRWVAALLMALLAIPLYAVPTDVRADEPVVIDDCEELQLIGNDELYPLDGEYILGGDIDCSMTNPSDPDWDVEGQWADGEGFLPIGMFASDGWGYYAFLGTFDGAGYSINGLFINRDTGIQGLFAQVGEEDCDGECVIIDATVSNLGIEDVNITASSSRGIGALAGILYGTADTVWSSGTILGSDEVGGLVGGHLGLDTIENASSSVAVTGLGSAVGGLVGSNWEGGQIINSHATGDVHGYSSVGGLVGYSTGGIVTNSSATGDVYGGECDDCGSVQIGGLIGHMSDGTITGSFATGNAYAIGGSYIEDVGGLVGLAEYEVSITDSYATGDVTAEFGVGDIYTLGGLVGEVYGDGSTVAIQNSYATGNIIASTTDYVYEVGGLVGYADYTDFDSTYAEGNITIACEGCEVYQVGGLIGRAYSDVTVADSWYTGDIALETVARNVENVGGLIGSNDYGLSIENSYATGTIDILMHSPNENWIGWIGGLVGSACDEDDTCDVTHAYTDVAITIAVADEVEGVLNVQDIGGLLGAGMDFASSTVSESFSLGDIAITIGELLTGTVTDVGGLIGLIRYAENTTIIDSYTRSNITIDSPNHYVDNIGGFLGIVGNESLDTTIQNSYAASDLDLTFSDSLEFGGAEDIGGFLGEMYGSIYVTNNFRAGSLTIDGEYNVEYTAGFLAYSESGDEEENFVNNHLHHSGAFDFCYSEGSGWSEGCGVASSTAVFKDVVYEPLASWDFDDVWAVDDELNNGYPYLAWYTPEEDDSDPDPDPDPEPEPEPEPEEPHRTSSSGGRPRTTTPTPAPVAPTTPTTPSGDTSALVAQLRTLIAQYAALGGTITPELEAYLGTSAGTTQGTTDDVRDLEFDMEGEDVRMLQTLLMNQGYTIPPGATAYFGAYTRDALSAYQRTHGITPAIGYFGPATRTQMKGAGLTGLWW